jgi:NADH-quinone oxidoreductase subunit C
MSEMLRNENKVIEDISARFRITGSVQRERRIWVTVDKASLVALCSFVKGLGFEHLSAISVTDWPQEGVFELTYHLWSYSQKILLTVKTKLDRANPSVDSVISVWGENAQIHERELHELFGVNFEGNEDLTPLFLEEWEGPPPFRKDFDWREYTRQQHYDKSNERERAYYD